MTGFDLLREIHDMVIRFKHRNNGNRPTGILLSVEDALFIKDFLNHMTIREKDGLLIEGMKDLRLMGLPVHYGVEYKGEPILLTREWTLGVPRTKEEKTLDTAQSTVES